MAVLRTLVVPPPSLLLMPTMDKPVLVSLVSTLPADELVPYTATTTYVSAGDAGANNVSAFRHFIAAQSRSRLFAFLHISSIGLAGFPVGEMHDIDYADVEAYFQKQKEAYQNRIKQTQRPPAPPTTPTNPQPTPFT